MEKHYTTGAIAKMCRAAPKTVSKWIDSGKLQGYRIPGGKDRRVLHSNLVRFIRENKLPVEMDPDHEPEPAGFDRVLVVGGSPEAFSGCAGIEINHVHSVFAAGIAFAEIKPTCIVVDLDSIGFVDSNLIGATLRGAGAIRLIVGQSDRVPTCFDGSFVLHADVITNNIGLKYTLYKARESKTAKAS